MDFELLRRRTAQVDEQHRAAMATINEDLTAVHVGGTPDRVASRRRFLQRASTGAAVAIGSAIVPIGAMAAAAQTGEGTSDTSGGGDTTTTTAPTRGTGADCTTEPVEMSDADLQVVQFAESVERAAVAAYDAAIDSGKLRSQVADSAERFRRHHQEHAEALYCLAGNAPIPEGTDPATVDEDQRMAPNAALVAAIAPQIDGAATVDAIVEVLYGLEEGAAATYAFALGELETLDVAGAAATILPIEGQHAVVWGQVLDKPIAEWMPSFQSTDGAYDPAQYAS